MTRKQKKWTRFELMNNQPWDYDRNFLELGYNEIGALDQYAEIFGIKSSEKSRARKLWEQMQECYNELPFK